MKQTQIRWSRLAGAASVALAGAMNLGVFLCCNRLVADGADLSTETQLEIRIPNQHTSRLSGERAPELTLVKVCLPGSKGWVSVSGFCHVLLFYGLGPTDLPSLHSGDAALQALTDETIAIRTFGSTPFIRTRNGLRYFLSEDPVFHSYVGEAHRDQCLATFAKLNLPLNTPIRLTDRSCSLSDVLNDSVANFAIDQGEPAWTAMAYARFLSPKKEWTNRFGERTSFSQLTRHLINLNLNTQSCAGTHIFQALVKLEDADRRYSILDDQTRQQLDIYLEGILKEVGRSQLQDGSWNFHWCSSINLKDDEPMTAESRVLVTGHLLEVLNSLDSQHRLPEDTYLRAAHWVERTLNSKDFALDASLICPFTHAARSARDILANSQTKNSQYIKAISISPDRELDVNNGNSKQ
jgi:hypothetical protein